MLSIILSKRSFHAAAKKATKASRAIDFRSDTVTRPSQRMLKAMCEAPLGDDAKRDCPTTQEFEQKIADTYGKEAAMFTPSGIMTNSIALKLMASQTGQSVVVGDRSHIYCWERGAVSSVALNMPWVVPTESDGTLNLEKIKDMAFMALDEHVVTIEGISLESSHNECNGRVLRPDYINKVKQIAKKAKAKLHLDGARSWNAAVHLGIDMKEMAKPFDLVSTCMSKGMGCPIGSLLVGSAKDIAQARLHRKMIGGTMRQTGILAACGLVALEDWREVISEDHLNAAFMAHEMAEMANVSVDPTHVETNILRFTIDDKVLKKLKLDHAGLCLRLQEDHNILSNSSFHNDHIRFCTHKDVSRADCEAAIKALKSYLV